MSVTKTPILNPIGARFILDLVADATGENDLRSGATTLFRIKVDNRNNTAKCYLKLYDATSPTIGTSAPFMVIPVKAGKILKVVCGLGEGIAFGTGLSVACVTAGGTGGTTSPTASVLVTLHTA